MAGHSRLVTAFVAGIETAENAPLPGDKPAAPSDLDAAGQRRLTRRTQSPEARS